MSLGKVGPDVSSILMTSNPWHPLNDQKRCWQQPQSAGVLLGIPTTKFPVLGQSPLSSRRAEAPAGQVPRGGHTSRSLARSVFCLLLGCGLELPPCPVSRGALPVEKGCTGGCVQPGSSQREAWRGGGGGGRGQCLSPKPSSCKYPPTAMLWPRDHSPAPPLRLGPAPSPPTAAPGW